MSSLKLVKSLLIDNGSQVMMDEIDIPILSTYTYLMFIHNNFNKKLIFKFKIQII